MFVFGARCFVDFASAVLKSSGCPGLCTTALRAEGWWWQPKTSHHSWNNRESLGRAQWCGAGCLCLCLGLVSTELPPVFNGGENRCRLYFPWLDPSLCHEIALCVTPCINTHAATDKFLWVFSFLYTYTVFPRPLCAAVHSIHFIEKTEGMGWSAVGEFYFDY